MFELSELAHLRRKAFFAISSRVRNAVDFKRRKKIDAELIRAVAIVADSLRAGMSVQAAVCLVGESLEGPLGAEFRSASKSLAKGIDMGVVLEELRARLRHDEFHVFASSIDVLRRIGGNLVESMEMIASTMEQRRRLENRIKTATAEARGQAGVLLVLPWGLFGMLCLAGKGFAAPLIHTRLGNACLMLALILELAGAAWLAKIVRINR